MYVKGEGGKRKEKKRGVKLQVPGSNWPLLENNLFSKDWRKSEVRSEKREEGKMVAQTDEEGGRRLLSNPNNGEVRMGGVNQISKTTISPST